MVVSRILARPIWKDSATLGLCALLISVGCNGDDDASSSRTDSPTVPNNGGQPEAAEGFTRFNSLSKGYSISYPDDWSVHEDAVTFGEILYDGFRAPEADGDFVTNVIAGCEPITPGTLSQDYLDDTLEKYSTGGVELPEIVGNVTVAGSTAPVIASSNELGGRPVDIAAVIFVHGDCGWEISLTAAEGLREKYQPVLLEMVKSFEPV